MCINYCNRLGRYKFLSKPSPYWCLRFKSVQWKVQDVLWTAPSWARKRSCIFPFSSLDWILCPVVNVSAQGGHSRSDPGPVTARGCSKINQSAFQTAASGLPVGEAACTTIWNLDTSHLLGQWIRVGAWAENPPQKKRQTLGTANRHSFLDGICIVAVI